MWREGSDRTQNSLHCEDWFKGSKSIWFSLWLLDISLISLCSPLKECWSVTRVWTALPSQYLCICLFGWVWQILLEANSNINWWWLESTSTTQPQLCHRNYWSMIFDKDQDGIIFGEILLWCQHWSFLNTWCGWLRISELVFNCFWNWPCFAFLKVC